MEQLERGGRNRGSERSRDRCRAGFSHDLGIRWRKDRYGCDHGDQYAAATTTTTTTTAAATAAAAAAAAAATAATATAATATAATAATAATSRCCDGRCG